MANTSGKGESCSPFCDDGPQEVDVVQVQLARAHLPVLERILSFVVGDQGIGVQDLTYEDHGLAEALLGQVRDLIKP